MRLRTIKPGFFENEDLAALPPHARLLFAGLWCLADRDGRLEDRPTRIKAKVFPYEDVPVDDLLNVLASVGFISRYATSDLKAIQIVNWKKHQRPHHKEPPSSIPSPDFSGTSPDLSGAGTYPTRDEPAGLLSFRSGLLDRGSGLLELDPSIAQALLQGAEKAGDEANIRRYKAICERLGA